MSNREFIFFILFFILFSGCVLNRKNRKRCIKIIFVQQYLFLFYFLFMCIYIIFFLLNADESLEIIIVIFILLQTTAQRQQ
jgi:hypothetical protein